eukprot:6214718-Pleurochrysis_carterae.AAC.3
MEYPNMKELHATLQRRLLALHYIYMEFPWQQAPRKSLPPIGCIRSCCGGYLIYPSISWLPDPNFDAAYPFSILPNIAIGGVAISIFLSISLSHRMNALPFIARREVLYSKTCRRSALLLLARMHCLPFCTRAACVLAERSALRFSSYGYRSAHSRHSLTAPPTQSHRAGGSSTHHPRLIPDCS